MAHRSIRNSVIIAALGLAAAALLAGAASARTIRVDTGSTPQSYIDNNNGQFWPDTDGAIGPGTTFEGSLPFAIDFGTGDVQGFCLQQDGFVAFSSCGSAAVISPLAANWESDPDALEIFQFGSVTYSDGQLDPEPPIGPLAQAPRAVRFHWQEVCTTTPCNDLNNDPRYSFQAILIDRGAGDFDLELNYGGAIPAGIGTLGFVLGTNVFEFTGDVANDRSFDFRFRNGVLVDGTAAVPEPSTLLLLALGLTTMHALRRRRSR